MEAVSVCRFFSFFFFFSSPLFSCSFVAVIALRTDTNDLLITPVYAFRGMNGGGAPSAPSPTYSVDAVRWMKDPGGHFTGLGSSPSLPLFLPADSTLISAAVNQSGSLSGRKPVLIFGRRDTREKPRELCRKVYQTRLC